MVGLNYMIWLDDIVWFGLIWLNKSLVWLNEMVEFGRMRFYGLVG